MDKTLLPPCDSLYRTFFYCWCDEKAQARHPDRVRADLEQLELPADTPTDELQPLAQADRATIETKLNQMHQAVHADFPRILGTRLPITPDWLRAADIHLDRSEINSLITSSDPANFSNNYLVFACELGALVAQILRREHPTFAWLPDQPYWESSLFDPSTRLRVYPFHWAIRKLSEEGADDGLADKVAGCMAWLSEAGASLQPE